MERVFAIYFLFSTSLGSFYCYWGLQVPQVAQKITPAIGEVMMSVFIPFFFLYLELFFYSTISVIEIYVFVFFEGGRGVILILKKIFYFEVLSNVLTLNLFTSTEPKWVKLFKEFLFFVTYNFL